MVNGRLYLGEVFEVGHVYHTLSPPGSGLTCHEPRRSCVWVKKRVFCGWRVGRPSWWVAVTQQVTSVPWGFLQASARGPAVQNTFLKSCSILQVCNIFCERYRSFWNK